MNKSIPVFLAMLALSAQTPPDLARLKQMTARFAPTRLRVDTSALSSGDQQALAKLIQAARLIDDIFLTQLWSGSQALHEKLKRDTTPLGRARLHYFWINKGPWSDLDGHTAFLPDVPPRKPLGANFYPDDLTREQFEKWAASLSPAQRTEAQGFFTVVRRDAAGHLMLAPYSQEYRDALTKSAALLGEAALLTGNPTLKRFLAARARA